MCGEDPATGRRAKAYGGRNLSTVIAQTSRSNPPIIGERFTPPYRLIYHDVVRAVIFAWGWSSVANSVVLHSMVAIIGAAGFLMVADRWREFYGLKSALLCLTLGGCWATVILGFALCMILTGGAVVGGRPMPHDLPDLIRSIIVGIAGGAVLSGLILIKRWIGAFRRWAREA